MTRGDETAAVARPTVRILLIDSSDRVLLFHMHSDDGQVYWCPPGGGLESGETHEAAALRELTEETGWREPVLGPEFGYRRHVVAWGGVTYDCRERWFLARVAELAVDDRGWTEAERRDMRDPRWWTMPELNATKDRLAPADLPRVVGLLLSNGPPEEPWALLV